MDSPIEIQKFTLSSDEDESYDQVKTPSIMDEREEGPYKP